MSHHPTASFGDLLRQYRQAAGLTQERLAERAGLSIHGIQKLEGGVTHPYRDTANRLASALQLKGEEEHQLWAAVQPVQRRATVRAEAEPGLVRRKVPLALSSFVGREHELSEVHQLLGTTRLLTLTGAAGIGKTRLGLEVARGLEQEASSLQVALVELAALTDPALVPSSVARALEVNEQQGRPLLETITEAVAARRLLLVLDNCEHLVDASAEVAETLLRSCSDLRILATSRQPLGVVGEVSWRVPSLALLWRPSYDASAEEVTRSEAVRLFMERARAALPGFAATDQNAPAIAQVCHQLDGIPLAIELAAARVPALGVDQIALRLNDRLRLLVGGSRTALPRQQTLRGTLDWSYELLGQSERTLFRRLAVFSGGWTAEAAETVCSSDADHIHRDDVLDLLVQLVDKSLVVADDQGGLMRYRFLETMRQYAWEKLRAAGEEATIRKRHLDWYMGLAEQATPHLRGSQQPLWLDRLDSEYDNLRAALDWSRTVADSAEAGLRLAGALHLFWDIRGYIGEGRRHLAVALSGTTTCTPAVATALSAAGYLAFVQGDYPTAMEQLDRALGFYRELGDRLGASNVLDSMGLVLVRSGGDLGQSEALLEESLALARELGSNNRIYHALFHLGDVAQSRGDYQRAAALYSESLVRARHEGNRWIEALVLFSIGYLAWLEADHDRAEALLKESLALRQALEDRRGIALSLDLLAGVAAAKGHLERAARLFGAAEALRDVLGAVLFPQWHTAREQGLAATRAAMGESDFETARQMGRAMPLQEVLQYAVAGDNTRVSRRASPDQLSNPDIARLTTRERDIAALLARGLRNRAIAEELVITEGTAALHVKHILGKLGFESRAQIAVWAVQQGLAPATPAS